ERQQRLWDKEIGSEIQYLKAKNQKESLEKKIETVNEQLKKAQITSPINGVVETVALKKGEMAAAGISGIRVIQMSKLKVVAPVSEKYFGKIKKGNKATIKTAENKTLNNLEVAITGKSIHPDDRTFSVEVNIPSNAQGFITNMIVELQILDYHNENALVIPINIIKKNDKNNFLFVAEKQGNKIIARKKIIETGEIFNTSVEIIKGLKTGDRIISSGYQELIDGATVIIK
ncbi:MAG: efflux RND transporter periplasmic adaptor subunit, partial [Bacteroidota bacterium]|nr:efflux RND transporter periplasmic adaptor subunit [Bacteroidota bacterium]